MNKLVSVIVPVYNVEKYIRTCIKSIVSQDYRFLEIILVDDGSPDKSPDILNEYALIDERIVVVHKKNGGVSSARNAGLKIAKGDYVVFVDGDDWIEPNYVSYFLNMVTSRDCVIGFNKTNDIDSIHNLKEDSICIVDSDKALEWIYLGDVFVAVWNKIYKTSYLKEHQLLFDESIWYGEGMLFNVECLQFTEKVAVGNNNVYHQVTNPESAMRKFNLSSKLCGIRSLELQRTFFKKSSKEIETAWQYHKGLSNWSIVIGLIDNNLKKQYIGIFDNSICELRKSFPAFLRARVCFRQKIKFVVISLFPKTMILVRTIRRKCLFNK